VRHSSSPDRARSHLTVHASSNVTDRLPSRGPLLFSNVYPQSPAHGKGMGEQKQRARHSKKMRSTTVTSMVVPREEGGGVHGGQKGEKPSVSVSKKHNEHYQLKNKGRKKLKNINNKKEKTTLCSQLCHKVTSMDCNFYENWPVFYEKQ
jgi:hypothetical protein